MKSGRVCVEWVDERIKLPRQPLGSLEDGSLAVSGEAMEESFGDTVDFSRDSPEPSRVADSKEVEKAAEEGGHVESEVRNKIDHGETGKPFVPERVKEALEKSKNFDEFRQARKFRFLHLYSGPRDILAQEVQVAAEKARLTVETRSLDRKNDPSMDLGSRSTHDVLREEVRNGEWDATHSGFPCGSFSRVRHRRVPGLPGPVDIREIHQGNKRKQTGAR